MSQHHAEKLNCIFYMTGGDNRSCGAPDGSDHHHVDRISSWIADSFSGFEIIPTYALFLKVLYFSMRFLVCTFSIKDPRSMIQ